MCDPRRPAVTCPRMGSSARGAGRAGQVEETGRGWTRVEEGTAPPGDAADPPSPLRLPSLADVATNSSLHLLLGQDAILSNNIFDGWSGNTCPIPLEG